MKTFWTPKQKSTLIGQLTLSVATGALISGYGRATYAGDCIAQGGGTYTCAGPAQQDVDRQQNFEAAVDLEITTEEGFGLDTSRINLGQGFNIDNATSVTIDGTASGEIISDGSAIDLFRTQGNSTIDITGLEITSNNGDGIEAGGFNGSSDLEITTGNINADADAIDVDHEVFGNVTINTTGGDLASIGADGVDVVKSGGGFVDITTGDIDVQTEGIDLETAGALGVEIDTRGGSVTTRSGQGFLLDAYGSGDINVRTADVTSEEEGVLLDSTRNGDIFIDTTDGAVESRNSYGVFVQSYDDLGVEVRTGDVTSAYDGVEVNADDTDFITIDTAGGMVTSGEDGVRLDANDPNNIFLRTSNVDAADNGVSVESRGGFDVRIDTIAGTVEAKNGDGIEADLRDQNNTYLYTGEVIGSDRGIDLSLENTDDLDLDAIGGAVTGQTEQGIYAKTTDTGYVQIVTTDVTGGTKGVELYAQNSDDIIIATQGGAVTGQTEEGILVESERTDRIDIITADVAGGTDGIVVDADYGDIDLDSRAGTVIGQTDAGIDVDSYGGFYSAYVTTGDVRGATYGVIVTGEDTTRISIDSTGGAVEGTANTGVSAYLYNGSTVEIATGNVTGGETGVYAAGDRTELFQIDTTGGEVTAGTGIGVEVDVNVADDIEVRTATVTGGETGVEVKAQQIGGRLNDATNVDIDTSAGAVTGGRFGILAYNESIGTTEIVTGDITGGEVGLAVETEGNTVIDVQGDITGAVGIDAREVEDQLGLGSQLIVSGSATGTDGTAIALGDSADSVEILGQGAPLLAARNGLIGGPGIFGDTLFGAGADSLSFVSEGSDDPIFSGSFGGLFDGGADEDTALFSSLLENLFGASLIGDVLNLDFTNDAGDFAALRFSNFERFSFADDADRFFAAGDLVDLFDNGGGNIDVVPLPPGAWLLASGLFGLGALRRRRLRHA
ncbi:hypothetical protein [Roseobacter sp. A03A-229]